MRDELQSLIDRQGTNPEFEALLGGVLFNRGIAEWRAGLPTARTFLLAGNGRQREAVELAPGNPGFARDLDAQLAKYTEILKADADYAAAFDVCCERSERLAGQPQPLRNLADQLDELARLAAKQGGLTEEVELWKQRAASWRQAVPLDESAEQPAPQTAEAATSQG